MAEDMLYVLDTHVLIWYFTGSKRLKRRLKELIDNVRSQGGRLLVPTIVLAEAMHIAEKGRVHFDFTEMYRLIKEEPEFEIVSFSPDILEESTQISNIPEIHDRIIVATAKFYQAGILTKDRVIRSSAEVETP
ncbi:MAG: type II toxin-antitoxin system VapC family toxin [Bacillota bacterium]|jgi:PIN domain nuclease of toxin-antitoxin system|nr:type II toxin-antitoxin system VapC family toxin [Bacillota bacterium]